MSESADGCVYRHGDRAGGKECRRYPAAGVLGGTRTEPKTVYRFAPCLARCGEYEAAATTSFFPDRLVTANLKPGETISYQVTPGYAGGGGGGNGWADSGQLVDHRPTCRGCYALGSACGQCVRCDQERGGMSEGQVVRHRFPGSTEATTAEVIAVSDLGGVTRVRIREVHGRREDWL